MRSWLGKLGVGPWAGLALAFALLLLPVPRALAEISVEAHLDQDVVALGAQATLTVTVNGSGDASRPALPDMPDFRVFPAGTARNFSFVNGRMASATVYTFLLSPKREGTFTIPPIGVLDGNIRVTSRPLTLTVGPTAQGAPPGTALPPAQAPPATSRRSGGNSDPRAVFLTASAEPATVYVGEQVTLTVRFYQGVRILERPDYRAPAATGFWVENLPGERTYYTQVEGRQYHVTELRTALFPTAAGELEIGPATVHCVLEQNPFQDPFSLFGSFARGEPRAVESAPIKITARALPREGRPADWSGAVGKFTIAARLDPPQVKVGEATSLIVRLTGQGNIRSVGDPKLPDVPGLRTFDSGSTIEDQREGGIFGGLKQLNQVLVAEASGQYPIPVIEYPVFRPDLGRYELIRTQPLTLTVLEGGGGGAALAAGSGPRVVTPQGGPDLRFIRLGDPGSPAGPGPRLDRSPLLALAAGAGGWICGRPVPGPAPRAGRGGSRVCSRSAGDQGGSPAAQDRARAPGSRRRPGVLRRCLASARRLCRRPIERRDPGPDLGGAPRPADRARDRWRVDQRSPALLGALRSRAVRRRSPGRRARSPGESRITLEGVAPRRSLAGCCFSAAC